MTISFDLNSPDVKQLDMSQLKLMKISEASDKEFDQFMKAQQTFLEYKYTEMYDTSNDPRYDNYAKVVVNGKVVAQVDNWGGVQSSNALGSKIHSILENVRNGVQQGPENAQARAEAIAKAMGGHVVHADSAMTQTEFNRMPEIEPSVDYNSMKNDAMYMQIQKIKQERQDYLEQQALSSETLGAILTEE